MYDIHKAAAAQAAFCQEKQYPQFVARDGRCYSCERNVYAQYIKKCPDGTERITGITLEQAGRSLITGCPHCNRSFCD